MSRILIAGCGYVGTATADRFHAAGWEVEGWTHSPKSAARLGAKPYPIRAIDLTDAGAVQAAAGPCEAVIHCASSGGGGAENYRQIYLEGARHLVAAFPSSRLLYTSSTSVYHQQDGEWVDETSPAEPAHETGKILRQTEEFVRENGGLIVRLAGIYGPGRSALLRKFLSGTARIEGEGSRFLNQAHRDDIAAALFHLLSLPAESRGNDQIFNVADHEPITQRACYEWLAQKLGQPLPPSGTAPEPRKRGASNKRVSSARLRGLGWAARYPNFAIGMTDSILPAYASTGLA
ncbi:MAG: NAD-dependent epimerase/dehydratase family protein [Verrucomicrobiota bacterium]|nr:NAD-dependent epimerase/dehydratase family protein [Verrucomicrobiota bacterium]